MTGRRLSHPMPWLAAAVLSLAVGCNSTPGSVEGSGGNTGSGGRSGSGGKIDGGVDGSQDTKVDGSPDGKTDGKTDGSSDSVVGSGGKGSGGNGGGLGSGGRPGTGGGPGSGGRPGLGGGPGSGGAPGSGGVVIPEPTALTCGSVTVAAEDVISDFSQTDPIMYQVGTRGGTTWYSYGPTGLTIPTMTIDSATTGPCSKGGALKVSSNGNSDWGDGFGVNFVPDVAAEKKGVWDAGTYTGVGFWAKCQKETQFVLFKLVDAANDADIQTPTCSYSQAPYCNQYGIKNVAIQGGWTYYQVYFSELLQDPKVEGPYGTGVATNKLTAFQIQMNTPYDQSGNKKPQSPYTCWVDDVHFLKTPAPAPKATCGSNYTTSSNKIMCGTTQKIFRGVARPSMEWDAAGFNVTPWDMAVMKNTWKANLVRIGLNQDFYMNAPYKDIYPKYVARAVKWAEAAGMDVILDLHWTDANHPSSMQGHMASAATGSTTFWTKIAGEFKSDPHVMFELYNEPTITDWSQWKKNYQDLYKAVRDAGANQITILGGLDWAYDLSQAGSNLITGTNIVYNTHPYADKAPNESGWDAKFGNFSATQPVIATEFGTYDCSGTWTTNVINYFERKGISWTAWGWHVAEQNACGFPALLKDYSGEPLPSSGGGTSHGAAAKAGMAKNQ